MDQAKSYLSKRFEFKYHLDPIQAIAVETYLAEKIHLVPDTNSIQGSYHVNSLYFDTPQLSDYRDKDGSLLIRKKVRARMYEESWHNRLSRVWLEVKHKHNMNIRKTRVAVNNECWNAFLTHNAPTELLRNRSTPEAEDTADLEHFVNTYIRGNYRPTGVVRYKRRAYLAQFTSPVRITFDYDIKTCRFEDAHRSELLTTVNRNFTIMEVKFNEKLPWWFANLLTQFDIKRTDFSKYRNSLATLRGHQRIPINK